MPGISLNPLPMTNAAGTFGVDATGYIQGDVMADPMARFGLAGGFLDPASAVPVWGGCGIYEVTVPLVGAGTTAPISPLGPKLALATQIAQGVGNLSGFIVNMQAHAMITTPQSPAPTVQPGMSANFFRLGSKARPILQIAPALASSLQGGPASAPVSWDFVNQQLVPYVAAYSGATSTSATYTSATGYLALTFSAAPAVVAGDYVAVTGYTGVNIGLNGTWEVVSNAANVVTVAAPVGLSGASGTPTGGAIAAGGGAIPGLEVLDINVGSSMTVVYNPATGYATWNRVGNTAQVLLN